MVIDFMKGRSYSFHYTFVLSKIMHYIDRSMIKGDDENFKGFVSNHWQGNM